MRRWRATCACWCASGCRPATATQQVLDFLVARYGEFVLLKPRFGWHTALLWLVPALVLLIGGVGACCWRGGATGAGEAGSPAARARR